MSSPATAEQALLDRALAAASDTRLLVLEPAARFQTPAAFTALFGNAPAIVIADDKSFARVKILRTICERLERALTDEKPKNGKD